MGLLCCIPLVQPFQIFKADGRESPRTQIDSESSESSSYTVTASRSTSTSNCTMFDSENL